MAEAARAALLQALRALPRGAGPGALRALAALLEAAVDVEDDVDPRFGDEFVRVLGPVMAEDTPVTVEDAAACATGVDVVALVTVLPPLRAALTRVLGLKEGVSHEAVAALAGAEALLQEAPALHTRRELVVALRTLRARMAAELSRLHAPVDVLPEDALPVARWLLGDGPPPRGAAVLRLARGLDDFCRRAPLSAADLEALRALVRSADAERDTPGWQRVYERLRTLRPRLLPRRPLPPLYRALAGTPAPESDRRASLEALLCEDVSRRRG